MNNEIAVNIIRSVRIMKTDAEQAMLLDKLTKNENDSASIVSFVNAHAINLCYENPGFFSALLQSDVLLRDGMGMKILFKSLGIDEGLNMNGTDFIPLFLNSNKDKSVALFGTVDPFLSFTADKLKDAGNNIIVTENGFMSKDVYLSLIKKYKPQIIILGMGMPKQELLANYLKENIDYHCTIFNGGAIIDFLGGKVKRAPEWLRKMGLEWIYRLSKEPRRLFKRYVIGNAVFINRILNIKKKFNVI